MPPKTRKKKGPQKPAPPPWDEHHPARKLLYEEITNGNIKPSDDPQDVWRKYQATTAFNTWGMEYGDPFTRRLRTLREQIEGNETRAEADEEHFKVFRKLHPRPTHNHRAEPLWDGSLAQELLSLDMDRGKHKEMKPRFLRLSRPEYQAWGLDIFRGHIHQESDTRKYLYTLKKKAEELAEEKARKLAVNQKKAEAYQDHQASLEEEEDGSSAAIVGNKNM